MRRIFVVICVLLSFQSVHGYRMDDDISQFEWEVLSLEEVGLRHDSFDGLETDWRARFPGVTGLVVVYNDSIIYEVYEGQTSDSLMSVFSVTKSIGSILIGIAIDDGLLEDTDEPISTFFPGYYAEIDNVETSDITIEHVLTMSTGLHSGWSSEGGPINSYRGDLFAQALNLTQTRSPGQVSQYNTLVSNLLSGILSDVLVNDLEDYTERVLFTPLGITEWEWYRDDSNFPTLGAGIELRTRDMARIGRLMLRGGDWEGQQIVSSQWVEASTRPSLEIDIWTGEIHKYGYLWWISQDVAYDNFIAMGYGGQFIYVVPDLNLVVAISSQCCTSATSGWNARKIVDDYVIPVIETLHD